MQTKGNVRKDPHGGQTGGLYMHEVIPFFFPQDTFCRLCIVEMLISASYREARIPYVGIACKPSKNALSVDNDWWRSFPGQPLNVGNDNDIINENSKALPNRTVQRKPH